MKFYQEIDGILKMPTEPEVKGEKLIYIIHCEVQIDNDGQIRNIEEIKSRYEQYYNAFFISL